MSDSVDAQRIYCTDCEVNYELAWDGSDTYVVCDCGARALDDFAEMIEDEFTDSESSEEVSESDDRHNRMYQ